MSNFLVCHARKITTAVGLVNVCAHNCRVNIYADNGAVLQRPDWLTHIDRAHLNEGDMFPPEVILKRRNQAIKQAEKSNLEDGFKWRKPQKNAAHAVEFSISASPEWFEKKSEREIKTYFEDCRAFLTKRFGSKNMLHWTTHFDETTPHMHFLMTPIIYTDKGFKYSSSEFLGGRNGLKELQNEIFKAVGLKNGLMRGIEGSTARHTDAAEYLANTKKKESILHKREQELSAKEKKIQQIISKSSVSIPDFNLEIQKKPFGSFLYMFKLSNGEEVKNWDIYEAKETALQTMAYAQKLKSALFEANIQKNRAIEYAQEQHKKAQEIEKKHEFLVKDIKNLKAEDLRKMADEKEISQLKDQKKAEKKRDRDSYTER